MLVAFGGGAACSLASSPAAEPAAVALRAAAALRSQSYHIEPNFISGDVLSRARDAADTLVEEYGRPVAIGWPRAVDTRVRSSNGLDLSMPDIQIPSDLTPVLHAIDGLRVELARTTGRHLTGGQQAEQQLELTLLKYQVGGHYVRHCDADVGLYGGPMRRSVVRPQCGQNHRQGSAWPTTLGAHWRTCVR